MAHPRASRHWSGKAIAAPSERRAASLACCGAAAGISGPKDRAKGNFSQQPHGGCAKPSPKRGRAVRWRETPACAPVKPVKAEDNRTPALPLRTSAPPSRGPNARPALTGGRGIIYFKAGRPASPLGRPLWSINWND